MLYYSVSINSLELCVWHCTFTWPISQHLIRIWSKSNDDGDVCRRINEIKKKITTSKKTTTSEFISKNAVISSNQRATILQKYEIYWQILIRYHIHTRYKSNARGKLKNLKRSCDKYARNEHCSIAKNDTKLHYIWMEFVDTCSLMTFLRS